MDPYLESAWTNVHVLMIAAIASSLKRVLPEGLQARPEEEVRIESLAGEYLAAYRPDLAIIDASRHIEARPARGSATALAEPIEVAYLTAPLTTRHVEIVDVRAGNRVVTSIEVLSPWNKLPGKLNIDYLRKLRAMEKAGANWVEIDLLRSPRDRLLLPWEGLRRNHRKTYLATVYRNSAAGNLFAYPISIRDHLPVIAVPLRQGDADVPLDLQAVLDRVRDDGPFDDIDYAGPLDPPLDPEDETWFRQRLAQPPASP